MKRISWMYKLLGEMVTAADRTDRDEVLELRRVYEPLALNGGYARSPTERDFASENCMLSCVFSVDDRLPYVEQRTDFLREAKKEYAKISKPRH